MDKNLLNTLWKFSRGAEEDRDSFIRKALKACNTFKVKPIKNPKVDALPKKTAYNPFYKDM